MSSDASKTSALLALSNDLATAAERAGRAVVAVNARPRLSSTGVHWSPGVIVAAEHAVRLEEGSVTCHGSCEGWRARRLRPPWSC